MGRANRAGESLNPDKGQYHISSEYAPAGDQPRAIAALTEGLATGLPHQVLLGVTGSGKTYTIANVIAQTTRNVIVISHNKTLASQLYSEFREFFPNNNVEYYISYFDYYRPEAYLPHEDLYINKVSAINDHIEALRLATLNSLLRQDQRTIVVASVASIYSTMPPRKYQRLFFEIQVGAQMSPQQLASRLIRRGYERNPLDPLPGTFRIRGDILEIALGWSADRILRVDIFGDTIEAIAELSALDRRLVATYQRYTIYPAREYQVSDENIHDIIAEIKRDLTARVAELDGQGSHLEAQRLSMRVHKDIDDLQEFGTFRGIENYSRYFDGRRPGERPYTIFDYLSPDDLIIIDESHIMIPQLNGMYQGDRSRKVSLVDYGFRLPSAMDNRPLQFSEFESLPQQRIYVSATPGEYEMHLSAGAVVRQIVRPTGLLEPLIEVRPTEGQIEDIYTMIRQTSAVGHRTLVLTTTKRSAEEISRFLLERGLKSIYLHFDLKTIERDEAIRKLRLGIVEVIVGINLLREGIDLPEVALVCVLYADAESFLRNWRSLVQISGRAARNASSRVIFYADTISKSMRHCIEDNRAKRDIQETFNRTYGITPQQIIKPIHSPLVDPQIQTKISQYLQIDPKSSNRSLNIKAMIRQLRVQMMKAARAREYEQAAELRDLILELSLQDN